MINPLQIIKGITNDVLGINEAMSETRMRICKTCPLYSNSLGGICNNKLWIDPETEDISFEKQPGYKRGCGCVLSFKTSVASEKCPIGKW